MVSLFFSIYYSWAYVILLIPFFVCLFIYKIKHWLMLCYFAVAILLIILHLLLPKFSILNLTHIAIDKILNMSIRNKVINFVDNEYSETTSSFIDLIVFNVKNKLSYPVYDKLIDLSIVYMIVISGFHLTIIKRCIYKLIKNKTICNFLNILCLGFYSYLLNFSLSTMRVLLCLILKIVLKNKLNKFDILGLSGLILIFLDSSSPLNYGFCLSYLCTCVIYFIFDLNIENAFIERMLINITVTLISLPFVLLMNKQISIWSILFSLIFVHLFCFIFVYFLLTFWIIWIAPLQENLVNSIIYVINGFHTINICVKFTNISAWFVSSYYCLSFLFIMYFQQKFIRTKHHDTCLLRTR